MQRVKNSTDLISIIVPVYNVEEYISRTIESILKQTYLNFELILVDDGSTDKSRDICEKFAKIDERIFVFFQNNRGVSAARNKGISKSRGKYIIFIDSDDWVAPNMLETYLNQMISEDSELVINEYNREYDNVLYPQNGDLKEGYLTIEQTLCKIINPTGFYGSVWGKIFHADIIKKNQLQFDISIAIGEDLLFVIDYIQYCSKISYGKNRLYNYVIRDSSALNTVNLRRLDIIKVYEQLLEKTTLSRMIRKRLKAIYVWECIDWQCRLIKGDYSDIRKKLRKNALNNFHFFLMEDIFSLNTKLNSIFKLFIPKLVFKIKYNNNL